MSKPSLRLVVLNKRLAGYIQKLGDKIAEVA